MFDTVICNIQCNSQRNQNRSVMMLAVIPEITFIIVTEKLKYPEDVFFLKRNQCKPHS